MATPDEIINVAKQYAADLKDNAQLSLENSIRAIDAFLGLFVNLIPDQIDVANLPTLEQPPNLPDAPQYEPVQPQWPEPVAAMGELSRDFLTPPAPMQALDGLMPNAPAPIDALESNLPDAPAGMDALDSALPAAPAPMSALDTTAVTKYAAMDRLDAIPGLVTDAPPTFTGGDAPQIDPGQLPSGLRAFTLSAPGVNAIAFPQPPANLLNPNISKPIVGTHSAPAKPATLMPQDPRDAPKFTGAAAPINLDGKFSGWMSQYGTVLRQVAEGYVDQMIAKYAPSHVTAMQALEARLDTYLQGGTGLAPAVEDAIYSRARGKNAAEAMRVRDAALREAADRGFTLPNGALMSALQQARQGAADNNARAAAEIVVQQAELEQKNLQFAVTTSKEIRLAVLEMTEKWFAGMLQVNAQSIESSKAIMGAVIEAYNIEVKVYSVQVDAWKAEVEAFEAKIKVVMARVQVYQAEISALQAEYQIDQMRIDAYKAEVQSLSYLADVYKAQIEATVGQASLEKLKVELFQAQVQAFAGEVSAKQSEWQGYEAFMRGQTAKVQAYGTQVQAYGTEVEAYKSKIQAKSAEVEAVSARNRNSLDKFKAGVDAYLADVNAKQSTNALKVESFKADVSRFGAETQQKQATNQMKYESFKARVEQYLAAIKAKEAANSMKVEVFKADTTRFSTEVQQKQSTNQMKFEGFKADVGRFEAQVQQQIATNNAVAEAYRAEMSGYTAGVQGESARVQAEISFQERQFLAYKSEVEAALAQYNQHIAYIRAQTDIELNRAKYEFDCAATKAKIAIDGEKMSAELMTTIGQISGNMAQASLSGLNVLAASTETI